jgi:hypothetical protein
MAAQVKVKPLDDDQAIGFMVDAKRSLFDSSIKRMECELSIIRDMFNSMPYDQRHAIYTGFSRVSDELDAKLDELREMLRR